MIRILVDSSSDYSLEEAKQSNMEFVPVSITIGEQSYRDGIDLKRDQFYQLLKESGEFPKTAQPSPQDFLDIFKDARKKGDDVICILLSSELSGTCQSAALAKSMAAYENIYIVDSLSATYVIRILAEYACKLREEGTAAPEIAARVDALKSRVKVIAALDTLEYLSRGGRLSKTAAAIGELANIKPIITVTPDGRVGVMGKALGKNKAICSLTKQIKDTELDDAFPVYSIYSYGVSNCEKFEEKLREANIVPAKRLQIGSTIGTHIGPEAFGLIYVIKGEQHESRL